MSKKNQHIKKYLSGKVPEPEVQADDAWGQMSGMLEQTSLPDSQLQSAGKFKYFLKYGLGLLSGVTIVAGSWLLIPESSKIKTDIKSHFEENLQDSIVLNETQEEVKANITENPGAERDGLQDNPASIENNVVTDSISNNKIYSEQVIDSKNQSGNSGLSSSEITLSNKKTNLASLKNGQNGSVSEDLESDHSVYAFKNRTNKQNISNRFPAGNRKSERIVRLKDKGFSNHIFEKPFNSADSKSSYLKENKNSFEKRNEEQSTGKLVFSVNNLTPKPTRFPIPKKNRIVPPSIISGNKEGGNKKASSEKPLLKTFHIGLEWNAASSFKDTKYLLPGPDSTNKPYRLLIPGIWISKDLDNKQSVTASFFVSQQYFAGNKLIKQTLDSTSKDLSDNIHMIKAVGINLSLQYNYQFYSNFAFSAGLGYSKLNRALFKESYTNYAGEILPISTLSLKKTDLGNFVQTNLITLKTGIIFNPGRFQLGANLILPITNVSSTSLTIRTLNGQLFFRFRLK